jgi:hypothetical protein
MEGSLTRKVSTDIDIDFANRDAALAILAHVPASRIERGVFAKHQTGVYFQDVPVDPVTGLCSILYEEAGDLGYFKIDFLNNSIYDEVRDPEHLDRLVNREPDWELLEDGEIVSALAHIREHFGTVQMVRPRSIDDLAVVLALIRPAKRHLLGKSRQEIDAEIWEPVPGQEEYWFKKAHAVAFALSIIVQLNLMIEAVEAELAQAEIAD